MAISPKQVKKIARLAQLSIEEKDIPLYAEELSTILNFVEQIDQADTANVTPLSNPMDATLRLRPDAITEVDQSERFQAAAPATEAGLYLVPQVIEVIE